MWAACYSQFEITPAKGRFIKAPFWLHYWAFDLSYRGRLVDELSAWGGLSKDIAGK